MRGEKILQFCIKTTKFRDSMCHLANSLDTLPTMLGFSGDWKKGFFPHKFNVPDKQKYVGPLPDRSFYEPEEMKEKRKQEFENWYIQEQVNYQDSTWDFQQNLHEYCKADVMVLSKALEVYDTLMKVLNDGISPLTNITLASYALTVFRNLYMPNDTLVVATEEEHEFAQKALHGGKTDVRILYWKWTAQDIRNEVYGSYVDVQSMYPFVQYTKDMPSGIPKWKVFADGEEFEPFLESFIGFVQCDIEPSTYLYHPIIGSKDEKSKKYVFDLKPKKKIILTSAEIQVALKYGYKVSKVYKALVYQKHPDLFKTYIRKFLKIKLEASGVPAHIDWETFARNHSERLGIILEREKMVRNEGMRAMSKLLLNSLWGKLGQDPRLAKAIVTQNAAEYTKLVQIEYRGEIEVQEMLGLPEGQTMIKFAQNKEDDFQNKNVSVAAFVAAYGRIYLWETLHKLGERVLYHDTDSIVYEHRKDEMNVEIGYMLGDWENELDVDDQIVSFVALGPKTYSYKTRKGKSKLKCKGFTLNSANSTVVTHQTLIDLLPSTNSSDTDKFVAVSNREFNWNRKTGDYWTGLRNKTLRFTADKNELKMTDYTTKPFGHENFH